MKNLSPYSENKDFKDINSILETCLKNIEFQKKLNAFINVYDDEAIQNAQTIQNKINNKKAGKLAGMIIGIKDLFCYKNHPVTGGSKILQGFISKLTATCINKVINEDAIIIGNQNCDEFGMGSSNENSFYGPVLNPIDQSKVSGGSSGGSAAAVKSGMCHVSFGTDTGGSVRQPAAFCGIVGLKPTYSRISRFGVLAYASSFDTVGILSQNIEDCAKILEVVAGKDELDNTSYIGKPLKYSDNLEFNEKASIVYFKETLSHNGLNIEIKESIKKKIEILKSKGHKVTELSFPMLDYTLPLYYILTTAEASANLSRYDGIRYGYRSPNATDLESMYILTRTEGFGIEVKRRILLGTSVLSEGYYDAYYGKAQKVRNIIKNYFNKIFQSHDFILMPTTPTTAFELNAHKDPISMYLSDLYTVPASVTGIPAISIPNGQDKNGLPIGLQVCANDFEEQKLLAFSKYLMTLN
ncbi:MAG: Asp-tRNA(Asn)/Glu-tRNA(Gln) amidotransferase subunit GatA [Bacteroidetes bacterium]|nr:Asp-tRNA(Asn)/Glu-tRNA(Gln) amidotransferase subunit GatA [Bacteroidota bacterium]